MIYHATEAAKPLFPSIPLSVVLGATYSPEVKKTSSKPRMVSFARTADEDFTGEHYVGKTKPKRVYEQKVDPFDRYRAVMSTEKFTSTKVIADALGIRRETVNIYLGSKWEKVEKIKHKNAKGHTINYWILKH